MKWLMRDKATGGGQDDPSTFGRTKTRHLRNSLGDRPVAGYIGFEVHTEQPVSIPRSISIVVSRVITRQCEKRVVDWRPRSIVFLVVHWFLISFKYVVPGGCVVVGVPGEPPTN